jgi:cytochrome c oxidase subunit 4
MKSSRDLLLVLGVLLALLTLSALTVLLPPAPWKTAAGLLIAGLKLGVIALFFMRLREHRGLTRIFAAAGLFWLGLLMVLVFADYLTRGRLH